MSHAYFADPDAHPYTLPSSTLAPSQQAVLACLRSRGASTCADLAAELAWQPETVRVILVALHGMRLVTRTRDAEGPGGTPYLWGLA